MFCKNIFSIDLHMTINDGMIKTQKQLIQFLENNLKQSGFVLCQPPFIGTIGFIQIGSASDRITLTLINQLKKKHFYGIMLFIPKHKIKEVKPGE